MKKFIITLISIVFISCSNEKKITLIDAKSNIKLGLLYSESNLEIFSDSSFIFKAKGNLLKDSINLNGSFIITNDLFIVKNSVSKNFPKQFKINNNFLESTDSLNYMKLKIIKSKLLFKNKIDFNKHRDFSVFNKNAYSNNDYYKEINLTESDLVEIDSIFNDCFQNNKDYFFIKSSNYKKQCIGYLNSNNEKVVFINGICKDNDRSNNYEYTLSTVNDGGSCFLRLNINLTKKECFNVMVNGSY